MSANHADPDHADHSITIGGVDVAPGQRILLIYLFPLFIRERP